MKLLLPPVSKTFPSFPEGDPLTTMPVFPLSQCLCPCHSLIYFSLYVDTERKYFWKLSPMILGIYICLLSLSIYLRFVLKHLFVNLCGWILTVWINYIIFVHSSLHRHMSFYRVWLWAFVNSTTVNTSIHVFVCSVFLMCVCVCE